MMRRLLIGFIFGCSLLCAQRSVQVVNTPVSFSTPPMGFNSWTVLGANATDAQLRAVAAAMVADGLKTAGYLYVGIDDGWDLPTRDANNNLQVNGAKFPNGISALVSYVHSLGLKFGIYLSAGTVSCNGEAGSHGYEVQDAKLIASYGVDFVKYDTACNVPVSITPQAILPMTLALQATGNRIILLGTGQDANATGYFYAVGAHTVRIGNDMTPLTWAQMLNAFTQGYPYSAFGAPDHWLDLDNMMTGEGAITDIQGQTSFNLWTIQAAPLWFGANLGSSPDAATIATLTNLQAIAVDQDALGITGTPVQTFTCGGATCQVWVKPLSGTNKCAIAFFNLDPLNSQSITATFATIAASYPQCGSGPYTTTSNLWANWPSCGGATSCATSLGTLAGSYTAASLPAYGSAMITVGP